MLLALLLCLAVCDNIQIVKDEFKTVTIGDTVHHSRDLRTGCFLKISYSGYFVYVLDEYSPGHFRLEDRTVYLKREGPRKTPQVIVEVVECPFGISYEVLKMIFVISSLCVLGMVLSGLLFPRLENFLREKNKKN